MLYNNAIIRHWDHVGQSMLYPPQSICVYSVYDRHWLEVQTELKLPSSALIPAQQVLGQDFLRSQSLEPVQGHYQYLEELETIKKRQLVLYLISKIGNQWYSTEEQSRSSSRLGKLSKLFQLGSLLMIRLVFNVLDLILLSRLRLRSGKVQVVCSIIIQI